MTNDFNLRKKTGNNEFFSIISYPETRLKRRVCAENSLPLFFFTGCGRHNEKVSLLLYSNHDNCDSDQAISAKMNPPFQYKVSFSLYLFFPSLIVCQVLYSLPFGDRMVERSAVSIARLSVEVAKR